MRRDSRLSGVLHILLHMAEESGPVTSETLAQALDTNPVVVRRIMAGLRDAGYVRSERGHGGGWVLQGDVSQITLGDVYDALGRPPLFAIGNRSEAPECLVEQAVNAALDQSLQQAEALLLANFHDVTLKVLSDDVRGRLATRAGNPGGSCAASLESHSPSGDLMPAPDGP